MGDVDGVRLQLSEVEQRLSSVRQTPLTSFGERLKIGLGTTVRLVGSTAASAGYNIPGSAVLGAAISGIGAVQDVSGGFASNSPMSGGWSGGVGGLGTSGGSFGGSVSDGSMAAISTRAAGGDPSSQMMLATQKMQEMNQAFNLQYLQLQQQMQAESRQFTAVSNVMKTKHDTARNALSNLK